MIRSTTNSEIQQATVARERLDVAVIGTGYVGLVSGTCFADIGHAVTCVDRDVRKINMLNNGAVPIFEPGLSELVAKNHQAGRLQFTTDLADAVSNARLVFLAVGTPSADDGTVDLSSLWAVVDAIGPHLRPDAVVVLKSTVPVETNAMVTERLLQRTGRHCEVANNPEFLREGVAIQDFTQPDRIVVGARRQETFDVLADLYEPYTRAGSPLLTMSPESAEMTKYVANALLATKISFINEVSNLCERVGADIRDVGVGIGHDHRIGFSFLSPGVGYGGSCFPKDVQGLASVARKHGMTSRIIDSVHEVNEHQKTVMGAKIEEHFDGALAGKTIGVWGLAFKPETDDIREAPALVLIDQMLAAGATVHVHDPEAIENVREVFGDRIVYHTDQDALLDGADALVVLTEWASYTHPDFDEMHDRMAQPVVFDGRNLYDPSRMNEAGFTYHCMGRASTVAFSETGVAVTGLANQPFEMSCRVSS